MSNEVLMIKLTGIGGYCDGQEHVLEQGNEAVIGRSRDCEFRIKGKDEPTDPPADKPFKGSGDKAKHLLTVSGKHVRITYKDPKNIFVEDLSTHGTFLDGVKLEGRDQLIGLKKNSVEMRLGTNETLRIEFVRQPAKPKPKITVKRRNE
jgi:pSer/pThr/pTyr-binding forkhead associated (FHA) protein